MTYVVNLDTFHGPLDLLLYLIEENEMDIYDISIANITDQYMEYLQLTGENDLGKLGDFLIMASYLLNLKSRMLLPAAPLKNEEEEEAADPREELVQKLLNYKKYKKAAEYLLARHNGDIKRVFYRNSDYDFEYMEEITGNASLLWRAYQALLKDIQNSEDEDYLPHGDVNISDKMEEIIGLLNERPEGFVFQDLFRGVVNVREALAFFLALLELIRLQKVEAAQEQGFGEIKVYLRVAI